MDRPASDPAHRGRRLSTRSPGHRGVRRGATRPDGDLPVGDRRVRPKRLATDANWSGQAEFGGQACAALATQGQADLPVGVGQFAGGVGVRRGQLRQPLAEHSPGAIGSATDELAGGDERSDRSAQAGSIPQDTTIPTVNSDGCRPAARTGGGAGGGGESHLHTGRIDGDIGDADAGVRWQQGLEERGVHDDLRRPAGRELRVRPRELYARHPPTLRESLEYAPVPDVRHLSV